MKSGESSQLLWMPNLLTLSVIFILIWRAFIRGGPTVSARGQKTRGGASTISSLPHLWKADCRTLSYTMK